MSLLNFDTFCRQVSLTVCPLVGSRAEPSCYARNVEIVSGQLIFQPATLVIHIVALLMTSVMIYHIKSKYTAVGRKEIVMFFYTYVVLVLFEMLLVTNIVPVSNAAYPFLVAVHCGLISMLFWILLLNGFVGFQWAEDGTPQSLWTIRISALVVLLVVFFIALATFQGFAGFSSSSPTALFFIYFIFNGLMLVIYTVMQIVLVVNTLEDFFPVGDIMFGLTFFILGQVFELAISVMVCNAAQHYVDGLFFGTICSLLGVMMVYKYWDSITKEDLEFSVGGKTNVWEIREGRNNNDDQDIDGGSRSTLLAHDDGDLSNATQSKRI